jgi:mRNA-degrading endonuclease toxin of MazEF toxin-antitoxin module
VVNVTQLVTLDKRFLTDRVGKVDARRLELVLSGLDILTGR